jgi:heptosyltransferase-2
LSFIVRIVTFHMDQLGDLLFSLPALSALRQTFADARIVGVVRPYLAPLLESTGLVDGVLRREKGWSERRKLLFELWRERFDVAVCFSQSRECILLPWAAQVPRRIGFAGAHFARLLTERVSLEGPPSLAGNLELAQRLGCATPKQDYVGVLRVSENQREEARQLLRGAGWNGETKIAVIAAGASKRQAIKMWTDEGFAEIANRLSEMMEVVFVGVDPVDRILQRLKRRTPELVRGVQQYDPQQVEASVPAAIDLTKKTSLWQLVGVLSHAALFVGVDSGVMHVAAALSVPVVALFGPTDPQATGPGGEGRHIVRNGWWCSPCHLKVCPYQHECLDRITADEVWSAIQKTGVVSF